MMDSSEWNLRYSTFENAYGLQPNQFLKEQLALLTPSAILLPGEGEGRNALWAAKQGWSVTAFDFSDIAKKKAEKLFSENGVRVNYSVNDVLDFHYKESFDAVALIYIHLPSDIRKKFHKKIVNAIKPKGHLFIECFHPDQLGRKSGGPKNPDLLPTLDEIKESFKSLHLKMLEKKEVGLNEGALHKGKALVIRMIADKLA